MVDSASANRTARPINLSWLGAALALGVLAFYVIFGAAVAAHSHGRLGPNGAPLFYDFSAFYEAGQLAADGRAASAYDDHVMAAMQQKDFPGAVTRLPWNYPPSFQLMLAPLTALPYFTAWLVWTVLLYGAYALLARKLLPVRLLWIALLMPAAAINLLVGQNGLLTTVLLGGGVLLLDRRPFWGGFVLGLLSYKPHLAVLAPLLLLCTRQWKALAGAFLSAAALAAASAAAFGLAPWLAFAHKAIAPASVVTTSSSDWRTVPSIETLARMLGAPAPYDMIIHGLVALGASLAAGWVWLKTTNGPLRAAALGAAALLVTPYLRLYDLSLLILPIAVLTPRAGRAPPLGESTILAFIWIMPLILLMSVPPLQVGAFASLGLLGLVIRQVRKTLADPSLTLQPA